MYVTKIIENILNFSSSSSNYFTISDIYTEEESDTNILLLSAVHLCKYN